MKKKFEKMSDIDVKPNRQQDKKAPKKNRERKRTYRSSYTLWLQSVPQLTHAVDLIKKLTDKPPKTDEAIEEARRRLSLVDYQLRVNREVRETCQDELKNRRLMVELRKLEMDSFTDEELEETFKETAFIRGFRQVSVIRKQIRTGLIERGIDPVLVEDLLNAVIPAISERSNRTLADKRRVEQELMADQMDMGAQELMEGLLGIEDDDNPDDAGDGLSDVYSGTNQVEDDGLDDTLETQDTFDKLDDGKN